MDTVSVLFTLNTEGAPRIFCMSWMIRLLFKSSSIMICCLYIVYNMTIEELCYRLKIPSTRSI